MGLFSCCSILIVLVAMVYPMGRYLTVIPNIIGNSPFLVMENGFGIGDIPDLTGKTIVITGANTGLGFQTAKYVASNGARTIMICRKEERCEHAMEEIRAYSNSVELVSIIGDLSSLSDVQRISDEILQSETKIDSLYLNAGIFPKSFQLSKDGIELSFAITHVAHHYMTMKLLPLLKKANTSTVVVVSSVAHTFGNAKHMESDMFEQTTPTNGSWALYGRSKLSNIYLAKEFDRRYSDEEIYFNAIHPGMVLTSISAERNEAIVPGGTYHEQTKDSHPFINKIMYSIFYTPLEGTLTQLYAGVSPKIVENKIRGEYILPIGQVAEADHYTIENGKKLWDITEKLLKDRGFTDY